MKTNELGKGSIGLGYQPPASTSAPVSEEEESVLERLKWEVKEKLGIAYSEEQGYCIGWANVGCSGGEHYANWYWNKYIPTYFTDYIWDDIAWLDSWISPAIDVFSNITGYQLPAGLQEGFSSVATFGKEQSEGSSLPNAATKGGVVFVEALLTSALTTASVWQGAKVGAAACAKSGSLPTTVGCSVAGGLVAGGAVAYAASAGAQYLNQTIFFPFIDQVVP